MIDRRRFLIGSLSLAGSGFVFSLPSRENIILGGGSFKSSPGATSSYVISTVLLDSQTLNLLPVTFLPHGFHRNPRRLEQIAVFEKKGPGALVFNLKTKSIESPIPTMPGRYFYGHGAYSKSGDTLYSTESDLGTGEGLIGIRDGASLKYRGEFPSYGIDPHECKLIDGGRTLVITNGGGRIGEEVPNIAYVDLATQRLIKSIPLKNQRLNTGHVAVAEDGALAVISAPRKGMAKEELGGVSIFQKYSKGGVTSLPKNVARQMIGEALSVCIQNKLGVAAVTHPSGNMVTFWSMSTGTFLSAVDLPIPRGVELTIDQQSFIVTFGETASLIKISVDTLTPDENTLVSSTYLTGSHIYNWSRQMSELNYPGPRI